MFLSEAYQTMRDLHVFVKRPSWSNAYLYLVGYKDNHYTVGLMEGKNSNLFIPSDEEIKANDYELVKFEEVEQ